MASSRAATPAMDVLESEEPPVIDISSVIAHRSDISRHPLSLDVSRKVAAACQKWGFFQCVGHGIPDKILSDFDAAMRVFFAADVTTKQAIRRTQSNSRGYFDDELTKRTRDWKECLDVGQPWSSTIDGENQWPTGRGLEHFRPAVEAYYEACVDLSETLLAVCAVGLGLPQDYFLSCIRTDRGHTSFIRLNHYPRCDNPVNEAWGSDEPAPTEGHLGINKHTDAGCITLLRQYPDEPASLQVLHSGRWHRVSPHKGALTINIGDMMQVWSNDRYVAPLHRVLASSEADRFSAPFFFNPPYTAAIGPVAGTGVPRYTPFTWAEFRRRRFAGDYADEGGPEVQISDWAIPSSQNVAAKL